MIFILSICRKVPGLNLPSNGTPQPPVSSMNLISQTTPSQSTIPVLPTTDPESPSMILGENGLVVEANSDDWSYDPNEPRYCVCNQVSYGDMVACDNEAVSAFIGIFRNGKISSCFCFFYYSNKYLVSIRMVPLCMR